ncbi:hypothetical protein O3G_MSEX003996 [Manduca sexta]|uniref:Uncharacterized protein n=2 Tax=Manduca sexta TaxID=7130 RepID=A0A921YTC5_MANSE|nr:hypothetical protein O3G_MSEX003996 [Manduca sexta]
MVDIEELEMLIYDFLHPTRKNMIVYNYLITEYNVKIIKHEMYNLFIFKKDMLHGVQNLAMLLQNAARLSNKPVNIVRVIRQDTIGPEEDFEHETTD